MGYPQGCTAEDKGKEGRVSSVSSIDHAHGLEYPLNPHPICEECGAEFSKKRYDLGYRTCLDCGEEVARLETEKKSQRVAVLCNKGPLQYITSIGVVKDLGK
jgi:ribosomal protein L37AE/L43A